jgi:hypothetical protein
LELFGNKLIFLKYVKHFMEEGRLCTILTVLHLILYEVPLCDFHHIDGDLLLVSWIIGPTWGDTFLWRPLLFMALDHLMEVLGLGSLTSPWLDDCACCLVVFSHVLALLIAPWLLN